MRDLFPVDPFGSSGSAAQLPFVQRRCTVWHRAARALVNAKASCPVCEGTSGVRVTGTYLKTGQVWGCN